MKLNENPLMIVFGIVMALLGIGWIAGIRIPMEGYVPYAVGGIAALLLILLLSGKVKEYVGFIFAILWLGMQVLMSFYGFTFTYIELVMGILPIGSGLFMIMGM